MRLVQYGDKDNFAPEGRDVYSLMLTHKNLALRRSATLAELIFLLIDVSLLTERKGLAFD